MNRFRRMLGVITTLLLLASLVGPAGAAIGTRDQFQTTHENFQLCHTGYACAQVFTTGEGGGISTVRLKVAKGTGTGNMLVEIRSLSGGEPTGTALASAVVLESKVVDEVTLQGTPAWVDVDFSPEAPIVAGEEYAIYLVGQGTAQYHWYDTETDSYSDGEAWLEDPSLPWRSYPHDFAFETYVVPLPTNAQLSDLTISQGTLSPAFSPGHYAYSVSLPNSASSLLVTPTTDDPQASAKVDGHSPSTEVSLSPGPNEIDVVVTAEDGVTKKTYTISAHRNQLPTVTGLTDQTIPENGSTGTLSFTIDDAESSADDLTVAASSLNPSIVPNAHISLGGSGGNRTISVTPLPGTFGTATIQVQVSDGEPYTHEFDVVVTPVNDPPSIAAIADQAAPEDSPATVSISVEDPDGDLDSLVVTATSSDQSVVPDGNIVPGGTGGERTLSITPLAESGSATITVTVSDGSLTASTSFELSLIPVNDAPVISGLADITRPEDSSAISFSFTVSDEESPAGDLTVNVDSSNPTLVPAPTEVTNTNGSVSVTLNPVANQSGTATISVDVSDGERTTTDSFTLTITPVNDPPVIGAVADQSTEEDTPKAVTVSLSDIDNAAEELLLTGSSNDQGLVPNANIVVEGTGSSRTVTITPAKDQHGTATITLRANDGLAQSTRSFSLIVTPVNDPPAISDIPDLSVAQNDPITPVSFTVSDPESAAGSLTVTATSSNQALVPDSNLKLGSTGTNRTLSITPANSQSGTTVITVTVSDGTLTTSDTFLLTISQRPTISPLSDTISDEDSVVGPINFTIDDLETPATNLTLTATSGNEGLVPAASIVFGGSGSNRTMTITPATHQYGSSTITVTVSDGLLSTSRSFLLTVNPINDAPTISSIADRTIEEDASTGPIAFTIGDVETPAGSLSLSYTSSNQALVPNGNIILGGSGANRTLTIVPANEAAGSTTITISLSDGAITVSESFVLTVTAVDDPPQINAPTNPTVLEDSSVTFAVAATDVDSPLGNVTLTVVSLDQVKVPNANIGVVAGGSGTWSVTVTPAPDQSGTLGLRLTASDGAGSFSRDILLTIIEINDPPSISSFTNQTTDEDTPLVNIPFTINDIETAADNLKVYASSDNTSLFPAGSFVFGGSGNNRTLTINPAEDQYGTGGVFVTVDDGTDRVVRSFTVTVLPVPDPPRLKNIADQTINEDQTLALPVVVYDPDSPLSSVTISFASNNQALVPDSAIQLVGTGVNRTLRITPTPEYSGQAVITITSTGEGLTSVQSFVLTVEPLNDPPLISLIPDQNILEGGTAGPVGFTVGDIETPAEGLMVTATSSNKTVVPDANIAIGGSGPTRTITVTPAPDQFGTVTITVRVDDGEDATTRSFKVNIQGVNDAPSFVVGADVTVDEDAGAQSLGNWATAISVGPFETGQALIFELTVDNPGLFAVAPAVSSQGTLSFTSAKDTYGKAEVSIRLRDGGGTENGGSDTSVWQAFTITINSVNDLPVISPIPDQGTEEGVPTERLAFTVSDVETPAAAITVTATSSNQDLVPNGNITVGAGLNGERWVQIRPVSGRIGTTTITVTADDGEGTSQITFPLIVNDLKLSSLEASTGQFGPPFSPSTLSYTVVYLGEPTQVTLTPVALDPSVEILVNGWLVNSGHVSPPIPLTRNGGDAEVVVRAPATGLSKTYKLRFVRALSKETNLADLSVSPGTLSPAFDPAVTSYSVTVNDPNTVLTVEARPADGRATVTVEGNTAGSSLIRVRIRAENGEEKVYTIGVVRQMAALDFVGEVGVEAGSEWATLSFQTNSAASASVEYQTAGGQKQRTSSPTTSSHVVNVGPLLPQTTYTFNLLVTRSDGSSAYYTSFFTTEDRPAVAICEGGEIKAEGPRTVMVRCPSDASSITVASRALRTPPPAGSVTASPVSDVVMNEALRQAGVQGLTTQPSTVVIRTEPSGGVQSAVIDNAAARQAIQRGASLEILSDLASITLSPNVVAAMLPERTGRLVVLLTDVPADRADVRPWLNDGQFRQASSVVDLSLATVYDDGRVEHHTRFTEPIRLTLKTDQHRPASLDLLGIYWLAEEEQGQGTRRVYVGGKANLSGDLVSVELDHLSTYVALSFEGSFKDVPQTHWAYSVIQQMAARQVIRGTSADLFHPEMPITRGQIAAMLVRALRLETDERFAYVYKDIPRGDALAPEIGGAIMAGLMMGYPDGTFHPEAQISRQELAVVLHRLSTRFNLPQGVDGTAGALRLAALQDWDGVASWAMDGVRAAVAQGLMTGRSSGAFAPGGITTRAEAATVVKRLLDWIETSREE